MHHTLFIIADPIGMIGVVLLLVAYLLLSTGYWRANTFTYQFYNLAGAVLILYSLCFHWNLSSFTIEVAWVLISLIGIGRIMWTRRSEKR